MVVHLFEHPWSVRPVHYLLLNQWAEIKQTPTNFRSVWLTVREQITIEDFQDGNLGGHLAYHNKMILAIFNLYVAPVPPTMFWLNPT